MSEERQKAIETLKGHLAHWERLLKEHICDETEGKNTIEAFKMSIASLEIDEAYQLMEEQPEFCANCIDREAVLKLFYDYKEQHSEDKKKYPMNYGTLCDMIRWIRELPSVLPKTVNMHYPPDSKSAYEKALLKAYADGQASIEPKQGHWIKYCSPRCGEQHYKCTACRYYINFGKWGEYYSKEFKYCPNCGARMVEPQESEDKE